MPPAPRQLTDGDTLYRVLRPNDPPEYEGGVPLPFGFMDKGRTRDGRPGDTLSFFVASHIPPSEALGKLCGNRLVRERCRTGKEPPSPELMYECGYCVAALDARLVIEACHAKGNLLELEADAEGNTVGQDGHVGVYNGDRLADLWSRHARLLTKEETFPGT